MKWIKKPFVLNVILVFASTLSIFVSLEFFLRFTSLRALLPNIGLPQNYYKSSAELDFDITPNFKKSVHTFADSSYSIWSNELGCFDLPYKNETPYIYLAGDSFTWGFAPFEDKWGAKLEAFTGVRTLKCGVSSTGTKQQFLKAKNTTEKLEAPKLIVLGYFGYNDPEDDFSFQSKMVYNGYLVNKLQGQNLDPIAEQKALSDVAMWSQKYCMTTPPAHPALQRVKCFLTQNSITYNLFKNSIKRLLTDGALYSVGVVNTEIPVATSARTVDYQEHLNNILAFSKYAISRGSDFLVVLVPLKTEISAPGEVQWLTERQAKFKAFLVENHIAYVDPIEDFKKVTQSEGTKLYWKNDAHWSAQGNHIAGLLVSRWVLEHSSWVTNSKEKLSLVNQELQNSYSITNK